MDSLNLDEDPTSPDWILIETEANRVARRFLGSTSSNESKISDQTINSILEETEAPDLVGLDSPATWHSRVKALDLDRDNSRFLPSPSSVRSPLKDVRNTPQGSPGGGMLNYAKMRLQRMGQSIYNVMSPPAQADVKQHSASTPVDKGSPSLLLDEEMPDCLDSPASFTTGHSLSQPDTPTTTCLGQLRPPVLEDVVLTLDEPIELISKSFSLDDLDPLTDLDLLTSSPICMGVHKTKIDTITTPKTNSSSFTLDPSLTKPLSRPVRSDTFSLGEETEDMIKPVLPEISDSFTIDSQSIEPLVDSASFILERPLTSSPCQVSSIESPGEKTSDPKKHLSVTIELDTNDAEVFVSEDVLSESWAHSATSSSFVVCSPRQDLIQDNKRPLNVTIELDSDNVSRSEEASSGTSDIDRAVPPTRLPSPHDQHSSLQAADTLLPPSPEFPAVEEQPTVTRTMLKQTSTDSISSLPKPRDSSSAKKPSLGQTPSKIQRTSTFKKTRRSEEGTWDFLGATGSHQGKPKLARKGTFCVAKGQELSEDLTSSSALAAGSKTVTRQQTFVKSRFSSNDSVESVSEEPTNSFEDKETKTQAGRELTSAPAGSRTVTRDPQPRKSLSRATPQTRVDNKVVSDGSHTVTRPSQSTNSIGSVDRVEQKPTVPAGSKTVTRPSKPESKVPGRESLGVEQDTGKNDRKSQLPCPPASKIARKFSGIKPPSNFKSSLPTLPNAFQRANKSVSSAIARPSQPDTVKPSLSNTITKPNLKRSIGGMIPAPAASKLSKLKPPAQQLRLPAQQIKKPVGPPQQKLPQEVTKTVTRTKTRPTENTGPMRATLPMAMTGATDLEEEVGRGRPTLGGGTVTRPSAPLAPPSPSILASAIPAETPIRRQDTVNPRRLSNVFFSPKRNSNMDSAPESKLPTPSTFKIPRHSQLSSSSSVGSSRSQNQSCSSDDFDAFKPRSRMVMNTPEVEPSKPPGRWSPALRRLSTVPDDERFFTCTKREPPVMALKNYKE